MQRYRPHGVSVTDLSAQLWCERQLEFILERGRARTAEMQRGGIRHRDLHEELTVLLDVEPKSLEDMVALRLHNCMVSLNGLMRHGITREIPIWGRVNSLFIVGFADELVIRDGEVVVIDTKTRKSDRLPNESQKRATRFQVMLYKRLFESARERMFAADDMMRFYGFNDSSTITQDFQNQIDNLDEEMEPNIMRLASGTFSMLQEMPRISESVEVRYENQETGKVIGVDAFRFDMPEFEENCRFVEGFWLGERDGMVVGAANEWKCDFCEFRSVCPKWAPK